MNTTTITTEEIKQLLEKFYDAETTPQEEATLKNFFQSHSVPQDMEADQILFDRLYAPAPAEPHHFALRLTQNIERWNVLEKNIERRARTANMRWIASVAATMLVLFSLATYLYNRPTEANPFATNLKETYDNPNDAAGETERALTKFSMAINKGLNKISNTETNERQ